MRDPRLILLGLTLIQACAHPTPPQRGRPEALVPILGGGGMVVRRTQPREPVEDAAIDLQLLRPAWPLVEQELPRLVSALIARGSWTDEHHSAHVVDGVLRVRHRAAVLVEVRKLVELLRTRLRPQLELQIVFGEIAAGAAPEVFRRLPDGDVRWDARAWSTALARQRGRVLARAVLRGHNGQWVTSERVRNQAFVSGVVVYDGAVTPQTTTLGAGFTIQGATWRYGRDRAVCAVSAAYTGESAGGTQVAQTIHRELPRQKSTEHIWQAQRVQLSLPVRELVEFQGQLAVRRGQWSVAALVPRDRGRLNVVLVRADWADPKRSPPSVSPLSPSNHVLQVIPIGLPTDAPAGRPDLEEVGNRRPLSEASATWFRQRAQKQQALQKRNVYNFQSEAGTLDLAPQTTSRRSQRSNTFLSKTMGQVVYAGESTTAGPPGLMPPQLERLRVEVMRAEWPAGTALEFMAHHVFVVHRESVASKVTALLEKTHEWRNRRVLVDVAFPTLAAEVAESLQSPLSPRRLAELRRQSATPPGFVLGRGGSWASMLVGELHTALAGAWAPDRSTPALQVYWRGARLSVQPWLTSHHARTLDLRWSRHQLEGQTPQTVAGAVMQQVIDTAWSYQGTVKVGGAGTLCGLSGTGPTAEALLVSAHAR